MKMTFEEILNKNNLLGTEILNSLPFEDERANKILDAAKDKKWYDIKIMIDGEVFEPQFLEALLKNKEELVKNEAKEMIDDKIIDMENKFYKFIEDMRTSLNIRNY